MDRVTGKAKFMTISDAARTVDADAGRLKR
jgi:hypothetical protein